MKAVIAIVALAFAAGGTFASEEKKEPTAAQKAQQEKMKACNKDAGDKKLKGDERKAFMKECLSAKPAA